MISRLFSPALNEKKYAPRACAAHIFFIEPVAAEKFGGGGAARRPQIFLRGHPGASIQRINRILKN